MHIAIKNPAETGPALEKMGDYHFGASLRKALEAEGVRVTEHYWPDWHGGAEADAVLVLRGRHRARPLPGQFTVLWAISHPSAITLDEIDAFDLAYLGSKTHLDMVAGPGRPPLAVLRQCSDFADAGVAAGRPAAERREVIFLGNSRGVFRDIVRWAVEAGVRPALYGRGWDQIGLGRLVVADYVDNADLPELYGRARLGLNDHWNDMRYFGYINNRLFDNLFCGLPTLSDWFPELEATFGDGLLYARDPVSFGEAFRRVEADYDGVLARAHALGRTLARDYTFAARARRILDDIETFRKRRPARPAEAGGASLPAEAAPEPPPAFARVAGAFAATRTGTRQKYVLLVHPSAAGAAAFAADDISVLTAGIGPGPWEVALSPDAGEIAHRKFDAVVVERLAGVGAAAALAPQTLKALHRLTRRGGWLVVPAAAAGRWARRADAGLGDAEYAVFPEGRRLLPRPQLWRRFRLARKLEQIPTR